MAYINGVPMDGVPLIICNIAMKWISLVSSLQASIYKFLARKLAPHLARTDLHSFALVFLKSHFKRYI